MFSKSAIGSASGLLGLYLGTKHHDKIEFAGVYVLKYMPTESTKTIEHITPAEFITKAVAISNRNKFAILSTVDADSVENVTPSSRAIQPFPVEFDEDGNPLIYFNTNKLTRKVGQLSLNPRASLSFVHEVNMSCVTYSGVCERVPYPQSTRHWEDWYKINFVPLINIGYLYLKILSKLIMSVE